MALIASFVMISSAITLGAILLITDMHRQAIQDVDRGLVGLSKVLADQADRALQAMEMVQEVIINDINETNVSTPAGYAAVASRQDLHLALKARIAALPQVNAVTIIDHAGKLLNFSRYWPIPDVNLADRDYFQALASDSTLQRFVSRPVQNRGDGAWTIYIARKVTAADGTFLGLVLGAVELGYFERLYQQITPTDDAVVSVFRNDGMLLVRHPHREGVVGKILPTSGAALIAAKDPAGGVLRNVSPIDGQERLIATRALARYPLILSISRTTQASLAPFRQQAFAIGMAAASLVACIGGLCLLFMRQARTERRVVSAEERARGERDLRTQYERFGVALDNMVQGLCLFDGDRKLVVMNDRFAELYAIPRHLQRPGTSSEDLRRVVLAQRGDAANNWDMVITPPTSDAVPQAATIVRLANDRDISVLRVSVPGGGWICTHEDVTERRRSEERLRFLARHDVLTRLPNRVQFEEVVARELEICAKSREDVALLCIDLDGFKQVNDLFGHPTGDRLLTEVAARLRGILGKRCIAARLGGDEFAVLATELNASKTPAIAAQSIIDALCAPYLDGERRIDIGCSVGIAAYPRDGDTYEQLLSASDMALVRSKKESKGSYCFFEATMDAAARDRHVLALDLRAAIGTAQFELHYQPQFDVASNHACGFEALLRWTHPTRGSISPAQFIPLAEETGLILPLGEWVLREACREAATWARPLDVAVNLSIAQFRQSDLCEMIREVLEETGLSADRLELEVTESLFINSSAKSERMLFDLKGLGVRISMDDFGTGYSSLATLQTFPFDKIKIDRSFVAQIGVTTKGATIVRTIINLGESLGVPVIAEGIETEEQLTFLRQHRCKEIQGYLRGKPLPISAYRSLIAPVEDLRVA
ncbi:EAL domain-containing protein [Methylobacterium sp. GC_Met_2]|uniref:bifunctional diguanylate cyclase/phosphodiesterase n=1 Tax=Methylobacterium sp. GC_Met_2 TaxID=2937376 RepID=UPI00226B2293|nr:EAL domain-containing protein [Methylobacterium sp. GC_Met_2]